MENNNTVGADGYEYPEGFLFLPSFRETYDKIIDCYKSDSRYLNGNLTEEELLELRTEWKMKALEFLEDIFFYGVNGTRPNCSDELMLFLIPCYEAIDFCKRKREGMKKGK